VADIPLTSTDGTAGRIVPLRLDVRAPVTVTEAARRVEDEGGGLDILVNNAALGGPLARFTDVDADAWRATIDTNLTGAFTCAHALLPFLLARKGTIVNIGAGAAEQPFDGMSAYCVSKAGLVMLTRMLAFEYGELGLRAYGFRPGMIDTDMQTALRDSGINK